MSFTNLLRKCTLPAANTNSSVYCGRQFYRFASTTTHERQPLFDKILIANRGEIACRVMKTAKKLGIKTVAVYSEADRNAMHVEMADDAYLLGPAPSSESYLRMQKIIDIAKKSGAKAIHPGYGFLSENADFAELIAKNGLVFIGPPASAIIDMGSKSASKEIMSKAGVPVVPGYFGANQDPAYLKTEAAKIEYPVLIKAVKGGGGKGMKIVENEAEFDTMLESAKREALKSFGDDRVLVEKYITRPRHVEVQVFGDMHGNYVYLFERDCSVQRRHQKIIEEAPAPHLSEESRKSFGEKAVAAARAVNYVGAGTVEFILDEDTGKFFFMEMNTRLQVEHPVTEMITNTDLVEWQLTVAAGNPLPKFQTDLQRNGWAFEARIYAENPDNNFLPDTGPLVHLRPPQPSETVRVETGVRQGDAVSVFYDPMISKLVVWAPERREALSLLKSRLEEFEVVGLNTNIEFLKRLASHPEFAAGRVDTGFIKRYNDDLFKKPPPTSPFVLAQAALATVVSDMQTQQSRTVNSSDPNSPWSFLSGLRVNHALSRSFTFLDHKVPVTVDVEYTSSNTFTITVKDGNGTITRYDNVCARMKADNTLSADIDNRRIEHRVVRFQDKVIVFSDGGKYVISVPVPRHLQGSESGDGSGDVLSSVRTPMPCKISQVLVKNGQKVTKGQVLVILEAMKMEHIIKSPVDGVVKKVNYKLGDLVGENKLLVTFEGAGETKKE